MIIVQISVKISINSILKFKNHCS